MESLETPETRLLSSDFFFDVSPNFNFQNFQLLVAVHNDQLLGGVIHEGECHNFQRIRERRAQALGTEVGFTNHGEQDRNLSNDALV